MDLNTLRKDKKKWNPSSKNYNYNSNYLVDMKDKPNINTNVNSIHNSSSAGTNNFWKRKCFNNFRVKSPRRTFVVRFITFAIGFYLIFKLFNSTLNLFYDPFSNSNNSNLGFSSISKKFKNSDKSFYDSFISNNLNFMGHNNDYEIFNEYTEDYIEDNNNNNQNNDDETNSLNSRKYKFEYLYDSFLEKVTQYFNSIASLSYNFRSYKNDIVYVAKSKNSLDFLTNFACSQPSSLSNFNHLVFFGDLNFNLTSYIENSGYIIDGFDLIPNDGSNLDIKNYTDTLDKLEASCVLFIYDARPDNTEMQKSVIGTEYSIVQPLINIFGTTIPSILIWSSEAEEDGVFISLFKKSIANFNGANILDAKLVFKNIPWISKLNPQILSEWDKPFLEIVIRFHNIDHLGNLLVLIKSLLHTNYLGMSNPKISIELPQGLVNEYILETIYDSNYPKDKINLFHSTTEDSAADFYISSEKNINILVLSSETVLSSFWFEWVVFAINWKKSFCSHSTTHDACRFFAGISLLPGESFNLNFVNEPHFVQMGHFIGVLYFPDHWKALHAFSARKRFTSILNVLPASVTDINAAFLLQGYYLFYPQFNQSIASRFKPLDFDESPQHKFQDFENAIQFHDVLDSWPENIYFYTGENNKDKEHGIHDVKNQMHNLDLEKKEREHESNQRDESLESASSNGIDNYYIDFSNQFHSVRMTALNLRHSLLPECSLPIDAEMISMHYEENPSDPWIHVFCENFVKNPRVSLEQVDNDSEPNESGMELNDKNNENSKKQWDRKSEDYLSINDMDNAASNKEKMFKEKKLIFDNLESTLGPVSSTTLSEHTTKQTSLVKTGNKVKHNLEDLTKKQFRVKDYDDSINFNDDLDMKKLSDESYKSSNIDSDKNSMNNHLNYDERYNDNFEANLFLSDEDELNTNSDDKTYDLLYKKENSRAKLHKKSLLEQKNDFPTSSSSYLNTLQMNYASTLSSDIKLETNIIDEKTFKNIGKANLDLSEFETSDEFSENDAAKFAKKEKKFDEAISREDTT